MTSLISTHIAENPAWRAWLKAQPPRWLVIVNGEQHEFCDQADAIRFEVEHLHQALLGNGGNNEQAD